MGFSYFQFLAGKCTIFKGYVSCSKKIMRYRKIIPDTVLKSLRPILWGSKKILVVRTHPEELRGLESHSKCVSECWYIRTLSPCSSSGWVLTTNIFYELENMDLKIFKTVSGIILRCLNHFLEHEMYPLKLVYFMVWPWSKAE